MDERTRRDEKKQEDMKNQGYNKETRRMRKQKRNQR